MFVSEIETIAEEAGLAFVYGSAFEINHLIDEQVKKDSSKTIFAYVAPGNNEDDIQKNNLVHVDFEFNAMVLSVYDQEPDTIDYDSKTSQSVIDSMRDKGRNMIYRINNSTIIRESSEGITSVRYDNLYGQFDAHLFGVGINCTIPADTGKTYCT